MKAQQCRDPGRGGQGHDEGRRRGAHSGADPEGR